LELDIVLKLGAPISEGCGASNRAQLYIKNPQFLEFTDSILYSAKVDLFSGNKF